MSSDEELYRRLIEGDLTAFDELYGRYERPLFGFLVSQLRDRTEAEDVLHEAFLAILRERQRDVRNLRAWLFQVARNLCRNRSRSRQRAARAIAAVPAPERAPQPEGILEAHRARAALDRALEKLPGPLAEIYRLRTAGMSYEEMATVLDVPLGTVKSRMHDMVSRLRKEVKPWTVS